MAIYNWQMQTIKRSEGRSSVAAAAYRAGIRLVDERTGLIHDFTKKKGIDFSALIGWDGKNADLWNAAESSEIRKDSRVARELVVAIPHELSKEVREALMMEYCETLRGRWGVALALNIHLPHGIGADTRNVHAHIQMTSRVVIHGKFGEKTRNLDLSTKSEAELKWARKAWETHANAALRAGKFEARIDCRSLADKGLTREPRVHLGPAQTAMERRGIETIGGRHNRIVDESIIQQETITRLDGELEAGKRREREIMVELQQLADEKIIEARRKLPVLEKALAEGAPVRKVFTLDDFIDDDLTAEKLVESNANVKHYEQALTHHRQKHPLVCWWADRGIFDLPGRATSLYVTLQAKVAKHVGIAMGIELAREQAAVEKAAVINRAQAKEDERVTAAEKLFTLAVNWTPDVRVLATRQTNDERESVANSTATPELQFTPPPEKRKNPGSDAGLKMRPRLN